MRESVSQSFMRASAGSFESFAFSPSLTSSCSDFPNMFDSHIFSGELSKSAISDITSSSDCFSEPTIGATSVFICVFIRCIEEAAARRRMPYLPPCLIISGSSSVRSAIVGITTP